MDHIKGLLSQRGYHRIIRFSRPQHEPLVRTVTRVTKRTVVDNQTAA